jgi:hypothetical protein
MKKIGLKRFLYLFPLPLIGRVGAIGLLMVAGLFANLVTPVPGGGGAWYGGVQPNDNGNPFWDNASRDDSGLIANTGCNVGYFLSSSYSWGTLLSNCRNDGNVSANGGTSSSYSGPGPLSFLASNTSAATPVGFEFDSSGNNVIQMEVEIAGWRNTNVLGYYTYDNGSKVLHAIFSGSAAANTASAQTLALPQGTDFGFFLCSNATSIAGCTASNILYSGTEYSGSNGASGKFALFSENPTNPTMGSDIVTYWIGVEDLRGTDAVEGWGDYNDVIFRASVSRVPETGFLTWLLVELSGALICLRFFLHRRRATS